MSSECETGNFFRKIKISKEKFANLIITIALEEYKSMLSSELIESYENIGDELYELIEDINYNTDNLDDQTYYRVGERLYYDNGDCPINCNKETELLINFCNVCGFSDDDYEDIFYDLLPKFPDHFEKKYGMDYYSFAVKNLAHYIRDEFQMSKGQWEVSGFILLSFYTQREITNQEKLQLNPKQHRLNLQYFINYSYFVFDSSFN